MLVATLPEVRFGTRLAVARHTLNLSAGVHIFLGPNGAGKTTALSMIVGQGAQAATLIDEDVGELSGARLQGQVGWLPQSPGYPRRMRVRAFLEYAAWLKAVPETEIVTRVEEALGWSDTADVADRRLGELSGGTLRRCGLAAAAVHRPRLLVLDEPTAGLDPLQRGQFYEAMRARTGRITLISTHLFEDTIALAEQVHVMTGGHLVWSGDLPMLCDGFVSIDALAAGFGRVTG